MLWSRVITCTDIALNKANREWPQIGGLDLVSLCSFLSLILSIYIYQSVCLSICIYLLRLFVPSHRVLCVDTENVRAGKAKQEHNYRNIVNLLQTIWHLLCIQELMAYCILKCVYSFWEFCNMLIHDAFRVCQDASESFQWICVLMHTSLLLLCVATILLEFCLKHSLNICKNVMLFSPVGV